MRTKKPFVPPYIYKLLFYSFRFFASILQLKHCVKICSVLATEFPLMAGEVDCFSTSSLSLPLFSSRSCSLFFSICFPPLFASLFILSTTLSPSPSFAISSRASFASFAYFYRFSWRFITALFLYFGRCFFVCVIAGALGFPLNACFVTIPLKVCSLICTTFVQFAFPL